MLWAVRGEVTLQSLPTWHDPVRSSGNTLDTTAQDRKIETSCYFKWTASQPALAKAQIVQRPSVVTDRITGAHCSIAPWGVCFRDPQWTPTFEIRAGGSTKSKHASCVQRPKILWNRCYCQGTKYRHHTGKGLVLMKWVPTSRKVLYTRACKEGAEMHAYIAKQESEKAEDKAVVISSYNSLKYTCHTMLDRWFTFIHSMWATMSFIQGRGSSIKAAP